MMPTEKISFQELVDEISELVQFVDSDGKFSYTNKAWREMLGYEEEEISRLNVLDIIHPDSREEFAKIFRRVLDGEKPTAFEVKFIAKDKHAFIVECSSFTSLKNGDTVSTHSIFRNITKRKNTEQALRESRKMFRAFMSNSPAAAFMKDADGRYVYANKTLLKMFQMTDYKEKSVTARDITDSESAAQADEKFKAVLNSWETLQTIDTVTAPDGSTRHLLVVRFPFTKPDGQKFVGGFAFDITERVEIEQQLRQSEEHYRHFVENSQGFVCSHDRDGKLLSVNPAVEKSLGYDKDEIVGKNFRDFIDPAFHEELKKHLKLVWEKSADQGFLPIMSKDGEKHIWKFQNIKITQIGDEPFILGYAQDVTEMKETENQLRELSFNDDLTGLLNRRGFLISAERQLKIIRERKSKKKNYLIFADMDGLKQINDRFGHASGSLAIVKMSEILAGNFRGSDVIARLGGDEFVVLVTEADDASAKIVLDRLQRKIVEYNEQKHHSFDLALSVGITNVRFDQSESLDKILAEADHAMYEQKQQRKLAAAKTPDEIISPNAK